MAPPAKTQAFRLRFHLEGVPRKCRSGRWILNLSVQGGRVPVTSGTCDDGTRTTVTLESATKGQLGSRMQQALTHTTGDIELGVPGDPGGRAGLRFPRP